MSLLFHLACRAGGWRGSITCQRGPGIGECSSALLIPFSPLPTPLGDGEEFHIQHIHNRTIYFPEPIFKVKSTCSNPGYQEEHIAAVVCR